MRLGRKRHWRNGTAYWDVMVALSVLLGVGVVFWTWGLFSIVPLSPHYPKPGLGQFWAHWAENEAILDQPLILFTTILFLLSAYLFVLFITQRGTWRTRKLAERTALGAAFILITGMVMVTDDLIDLVTSRYRLDKWEGTPFGARSSLLIVEEILETYDPDARFAIKIGTEWVFLPDADTIYFGQRDYRLWGIDALQAEQHCQGEDNRPVYCGLQAREALLKLMKSVPPSAFSCRFPDQAFYPRTISCRAGGQDIAEWLVRRGYAFPTRAGRHRYREALRMAKAEKAGAWGTTFLHPREWRAARCERFLGVCRRYYGAD